MKNIDETLEHDKKVLSEREEQNIRIGSQKKDCTNHECTSSQKGEIKKL